MTLREKLIVLRDKAGITQMSLAHQLGVSRQAVTRWESGDTAPSMDKLKALAKIYDVSLDWLCSDCDVADEKPFEIVEPSEDNETNNATTSEEDKKRQKIRYIAIALAVGVITLACIWLATRLKNNEMTGAQFEDMDVENVDMQETMKIEIEAGEYIFTATGYTVKFDGFTKLYEEKVDDEKSDSASPLPALKEGDELKLKSILGNQHFTQPPARYTEASLTKALEENGVGRPSTYVTITSTILNREYVKREGKQFVPTELGEAVTNLLKDKMPNIVNVKYTSKMEADLDKIDSGEKNYKDMIRLYYDDFEKPLEKAKEEMQGVKIKLKEEETDEICEKCGRNMVVKVGRFGKFLACPGYPECKNTKPLIFRTKAKCPECGGDVIEKKTKRGSSFYGCSNYPKCNFMTWDAPSDEVCPRCGKSLFKRKGNVLYCPDTEGCGFTKPAPRKKKTEE